jgi:Na+-transporting methylmalonyl-CoA/oxaloacetate decarboxylase gamma subunit
MYTALIITVIGMSLVFAAILLLWGLMALIVRLGASSPSETQKEQSREMEMKKLAAAAAVATALSGQPGETLHEFPLPPTAIVSPWQAVMRSKMLNKRGPQR